MCVTNYRRICLACYACFFHLPNAYKRIYNRVLQSSEQLFSPLRLDATHLPNATQFVCFLEWKSLAWIWQMCCLIPRWVLAFFQVFYWFFENERKDKNSPKKHDVSNCHSLVVSCVVSLRWKIVHSLSCWALVFLLYYRLHCNSLSVSGCLVYSSH